MINNFFKSITDFGYYKYFTKEKISRAIIYFFVFSSIIGLLTSIKPVINYIRAVDALEKELTEEFKFTFSEGRLEFEFEQPKIIEEGNFIIYLNTNMDFSEELIDEYDQGIFIFSDSMVQKDTRYRMNKTIFEDLYFLNFTNENVVRLIPYLKFLSPIITIIFIIFSIIDIFIMILFLLIMGIAFNFVLKSNLNKKKIFIISIYSVTTPVLFKFFLSTANMYQPVFIFPIYLLGIIYLWHGIRENI